MHGRQVDDALHVACCIKRSLDGRCVVSGLVAHGPEVQRVEDFPEALSQRARGGAFGSQHRQRARVVIDEGAQRGAQVHRGVAQRVGLGGQQFVGGRPAGRRGDAGAGGLVGEEDGRLFLRDESAH
jgi:hypothetical protein